MRLRNLLLSAIEILVEQLRTEDDNYRLAHQDPANMGGSSLVVEGPLTDSGLRVPLRSRRSLWLPEL